MRRDYPLDRRENFPTWERRDRGPGLGRVLSYVCAIYMDRYMDAGLTPGFIRHAQHVVAECLLERFRTASTGSASGQQTRSEKRPYPTELPDADGRARRGDADARESSGDAAVEEVDPWLSDDEDDHEDYDGSAP